MESVNFLVNPSNTATTSENTNNFPSVNTVNTNEYVSDTNLEDRTISTDYNIPIQSLFVANFFEEANILIQQLRNSIFNKNIDLSCIQKFLQLHKLAKPEYRNLFIEQWQENEHKFILAGYFELISPIKLTQQNSSIESLAEEIYAILNNQRKYLDDSNETNINNIIIILLMLIEKRIISGETALPTKYEFSASYLQTKIIDHYNTYIHQDLSSNQNMNLNLVNKEIGKLKYVNLNYVFTRAENFLGNSFEVSCKRKDYYHSRIRINLNEISPLEENKQIYTNLFSKGNLLLLLAKKDYELAFNYLYLSKYLLSDIEYVFTELSRYIFSSLFEYSDDKFNQHIEKILIHMNKLLACGTLNIDFNNNVRHIIAYYKSNPTSMNINEQIKFKYFVLLLEYMPTYQIFDLPLSDLLYFISDKNKKLCLLDYILNFAPQEKQKKILENVITIITSLSCSITEDQYIAVLHELHKEQLEPYYGAVDKWFILKVLDDMNKNPIINNEIHTDEIIDVVLKIIQSNLQIYPNKIEEYFYTSQYNIAIMQLILVGINSNKPQIVKNAESLFIQYLSFNDIKRILKNPDFLRIFGDLNGNPLLNNKKHEDTLNYILISQLTYAVFNGKPIIFMLLPDNTLVKLLDKTSDIPIVYWLKFAIFDQNGNNLPNNQYSIRELFTKYFPIFSKKFYESISKSVLSRNFIKSLSLGEYEKVLISAFDTNNIQNNLFISDKILNEDSHDNKLYKLLVKYIDINDDNTNEQLLPDISGIIPEHLNNIKQLFKLENKENSEIAKYLVCIAYTFITFSAKNIFGSETNSPFSIRFYAQALLKEAYKLDKNSFPLAENTDKIEPYIDWQNRLTGKSFSCASVLSSIIINHITTKYDDNIYSNVIPLNLF